MFCQKCGVAVMEGNKFCNMCGNKIHIAKENQEEPNQQPMSTVKEIAQEPKKVHPKKVVIPIVITCILAVGFIFGFVFGMQDREGFDEVGFDTPEGALIFYLEGLRDSDLDKMVSSFATETFVKNLDLEVAIAQSGFYFGPYGGRMPNVNDFVEAINLESRILNINRDIALQYLTLAQVEFELTREHRLVPNIFDVEDPEAARTEAATAFTNQFMEDLDSLDLQSLEIIGFIPPEALVDSLEIIDDQINLEQRVTLFGVDELVSCVAVFRLGGHQYILFADVGKYDGRWHLLRLGGDVAVLLDIPFEHSGLLMWEDIDLYLPDIDSIEDLIVPIG
jgi:hypothetical protein